MTSRQCTNRPISSLALDFYFIFSLGMSPVFWKYIHINHLYFTTKKVCRFFVIPSCSCIIFLFLKCVTTKKCMNIFMSLLFFNILVMILCYLENGVFYKMNFHQVLYKRLNMFSIFVMNYYLWHILLTVNLYQIKIL